LHTYPFCAFDCGVIGTERISCLGGTRQVMKKYRSETTGRRRRAIAVIINVTPADARPISNA
jgi:hypothetical protein